MPVKTGTEVITELHILAGTEDVTEMLNELILKL